MPWRQETIMSRRYEFVQLASAEEANMSALCERVGITRATGYKWRYRYQQEGQQGLCERSRKLHHSPNRTGRSVPLLLMSPVYTLPNKVRRESIGRCGLLPQAEKP